MHSYKCVCRSLYMYLHSYLYIYTFSYPLVYLPGVGVHVCLNVFIRTCAYVSLLLYCTRYDKIEHTSQQPRFLFPMLSSLKMNISKARQYDRCLGLSLENLQPVQFDFVVEFARSLIFSLDLLQTRLSVVFVWKLNATEPERGSGSNFFFFN